MQTFYKLFFGIVEVYIHRQIDVVVVAEFDQALHSNQLYVIRVPLPLPTHNLSE